MLRTAALLLLALLVSGVGLVDAWRGGDSDLTTLLAVLVVLNGAALAGLRSARRGPALRPDLTAWLHQQAGATGEPVDRLADRCVAAYRAGLVDDRELST